MNMEEETNNDDERDSLAPTPPPPMTEEDRHDKHLGRTAYRRFCEKNGFEPSAKVIAMLGTEHLVINHRGIDKVHLDAIAAALLVNEQITHLDFSNNGLRAKSMDHFFQALQDHAFISELNLSQNYLSHYGASLIGNLIKNHKSITVLKLSECQFADRDGLVLRLGLEENDRIVELDLSKNTFEEEAATHLGIALGSNTTLRVLNLSWNSIRGNGGVHLFKGIKRNFGLSSVDVSWNGLAYDGAVAIGDCLQHNNTIEMLDITSNRINWLAIEVIAKGLKRNSSLKVLKIGHNPLTTTGALTLLESVKGGICQLEQLDIPGVQVIVAFEHMAKYIANRRNFTWEHGGVVPSHDVVGQKLERAVDPMRKIMDFIRTSEIRPLELFRDFDKSQSGAVINMQFAERMRRAGLALSDYEMDVILQQLLDDGPGSVEYKKLVRGISNQILLERKEKYIEIQKQTELEKLHKKILANDKGVGQASKTAMTSDGKLSREYTTLTMSPSESKSLAHMSSIEFLPPIGLKSMADIELASVPAFHKPRTSSKKGKKGRKKKGKKTKSSSSLLY